MKALVESGSTKSEWRFSGGEKFILPGMNVSAMSMKNVKGILAEGLSKIGDASSLNGVFLYTAGEVTPAVREEITTFIRTYAPSAVIDVQDDLVGACRAALGDQSGIVAIMGTGSNTGFYDGAGVSHNVFSGGYILGDKGSASELGRLFLADWIKFDVPEDVAADIGRKFDSSFEAIINNLYNGDTPSRYLGSLAPLIMSHYDSSEYVRNLVDGNIRAFARKSILAYDVDNYPVAVIGGFGWACRGIVSRIFAECGIRISRFIPAPIEGLAEYHSL